MDSAFVCIFIVLLRINKDSILAGLLCSSLNTFEQALYAPNFADPAAGWRRYGNDTTFVDWCAMRYPSLRCNNRG